ncbi:hypothetical protein CN221_27410 [Sinorhizobium meliloti]|uniref:hypothetical protein n=1 Tax=Rhizobium meliloti TaxID=382 RepID=UPI000FE0BA53|nr:hypothetical protein [Sinorhizobium meliloti]RVG88465.1 hypothetical protein CN221_27410 [Sinorhizobium meliloti]RVH60028.1 hypothetical protein CN209_25590 [Sinorhizobium meliloti]
MSLVDFSPWTFEFKHDSAFEHALGRGGTEVFNFGCAQEFLLHIAQNLDDRGRFQNELGDRLKANSICKSWKKSRGKLAALKEFSKYRRRHYDAYHNAALAIWAGGATAKQTKMVRGLTAEIDMSPVVLKAGQQVFHGRSEPLPVVPQAYPSFVSTSMEPVVAANHSFKRSGPGSRPQVYILTSNFDIRAIWGHAPGTVEWELLLPPGLVIEEKVRRGGKAFDVVVASILSRSSPP